MSVIRIKKSHKKPYVILDTTALNDARLSFRAKGLHTYLMAKPDDWQVYIEQLEKLSPTEGRDAIRGAMKELEAHGYVKRTRTRDEKGRLVGWHTTVYETAALALEETTSDDAITTTIGLSESPLPKSAEPKSAEPKSAEPKSVLPNSANPQLLRIDRDQGLRVPRIEGSSLTSFDCSQPVFAAQGEKFSGGKPSGKTPHPARSRFLPDAFVITDDLRTWAHDTVPHVDLDVETDKLRDHEFKDPHSDWVKVWRNWMRRAEEQPRKPWSHARSRSTRDMTTEELAAYLAAPED